MNSMNRLIKCIDASGIAQGYLLLNHEYKVVDELYNLYKLQGIGGLWDKYRFTDVSTANSLKHRVEVADSPFNFDAYNGLK